jgi:hypothetical protein
VLTRIVCIPDPKVPNSYRKLGSVVDLGFLLGDLDLDLDFLEDFDWLLPPLALTGLMLASDQMAFVVIYCERKELQIYLFLFIDQTAIQHVASLFGL